MADAFRVANAPRKGPVQVNLARDVLSGDAEFDPFVEPRAYRQPHVAAPSPEAITQAVNMLRDAKRPVIIVGGGIKNERAQDDAFALAEALNAPLVSAPGHGDALALVTR